MSVIPGNAPTDSTGEPDYIAYAQEFIHEYLDDIDGYGDGLAQALQQHVDAVGIDINELTRFDHEFVDALLADPDAITEAFEKAFRRYDAVPDDQSWEPDVVFQGLDSIPEPDRYVVGDYGADDTDRLRVVEGQVARVAQSKVIQTTICFQCERCGTRTSIPQSEGDLQTPHECSGCERQGPFTRDKDGTVEHNYQLIRLQRPPERARSGTQPDKIDVTLTGDLVGEVTPGDRVKAAVKLERDYDEDSPTYTIRGDASGVEHQESDFEDIDYDEYRDDIEDLAAADNTREQIVDSIKPSHRGNSHIKEAIALQMFGGVKKTLPDGSEIRGTPHVMLVGDPGTDKSGLAHYATQLAPRSVYTSGKNATAAGLTCAAVQSDFGDGGWTLQAGALVKADGGLCAIDEFDKVEEDEREGVHEALSNGTISPSKAGITNVTLPADATVLACANPIYGRFDKYEPIGDQIDLNPTLLSRFDLMFTMTDDPDPEEDADLAEHLLSAARVGQERAAGSGGAKDEGATTPPIKTDVLRAYIAFAKENCSPQLTDEAKARLKEFYVSIREDGVGDDQPVPITARKIDALVRLAEAAAKMRLSDEITLDDAEHVIEIVTRSLEDVGMDPETGELDADVVETGVSKSQHDRLKTLKAVIDDIAGEQPAPMNEILTEMEEQGYSKAKARDDIESLSKQGEVYNPRGEGWRTS